MTFCTRLLGLLFVAHLSLAATNLSITPPNDSLMFSPGWETGFNGQFLLVDDLGAVLSASLPGTYMSFSVRQSRQRVGDSIIPSLSVASILHWPQALRRISLRLLY